MEIEVGEKKTFMEKLLNVVPKIDKFLWILDLKIGVLITAIVLFVLFILFGTTSAYDSGHGGHAHKGHGHSHILGSVVPAVISILLLIVNVVVLTLVIVGIQKELRNLLVPALIWCIIYPVINFVIVVYSLVLFHWMTFVVSLLILFIQLYFWLALVSVYDRMSSRIKVTVPVPELKIERK